MNSPERAPGPSLRRFDHLPLTHETVQAKGAYLDAYHRLLGPLLTERARVEVDRDIAAERLRSTQIAHHKDAAIERLQAQLRALQGVEPAAASTRRESDSSEAQATYDALQAQITNLDARIEEKDAKLLKRFGFS